MTHKYPPPDQALAEHPKDYSDPELKEYTDEFAQDILDEVTPIMPMVFMTRMLPSASRFTLMLRPAMKRFGTLRE